MGDSYTISSISQPTSDQDRLIKRDASGKFLPSSIANPTGKGGLGDNPQNINEGGRPKNQQRFGYWLQFFKNMTNEEFINYAKVRGQSQMFVAELIAYERVLNARNNLKEYKDLADRTEGRAVQSIDLTSKGEKITAVQVEIIKRNNEIKIESDDSI